MAYGTVKTDNLIYDNSGDQSVSVLSLAAKAATASPTFTGTPAAPTAADGTNSTQIATTAFVDSGFAKKASPTFTGTPAAPTAAANTNTTQIATTAYVQGELTDKAPLASPTFTGTINGAALTLTGDLTVGGTTTTINSATLTVDDKNIELGSVDTPSDTTADGGGITLKGATDKEIKWVNATDAWTFNQNISTTGTIKATPAKNANNDGFEITPADGTTASSFKILGNNNAGADGRNGGVVLIDANYYATSSTIFNIKGRGTDLISVLGNGNLTAHTGSISDSKGDLRNIPVVSKSAAYTLVAADAGKCIVTDSNVTIPNSTIGGGDAVTIVNNSGSDITITASIGTLYNTADAATGNRTLAGRGMATILFMSGGTSAYISGSGLS